MDDINLFYIDKFTDIIQPYEFIEIGAYDFDKTIKILDSLKKVYEKNKVTYIIVANNKNILEEYKNKFSSNKNIEFKFYLLSDYLDKFNNDESFSENTEFMYFNFIEDYSKVNLDKNKLENIKCVLFDRYAKDKNVNNKFCNNFVKNFNHVITPESYTLFEDLNIYDVCLCIAGIISESISIEKNKPQDDNLVNLNPSNSLPKEKIHEHIRKNILFARENNITEIFPCEIHDSVALLVAGAESYKKEEYFNIIRNAKTENKEYVFVSKTSHDYVIERGVVPFGCILLDPREHVVEKIKNSHRDVIYFVASQCDPRVVEYLCSQNRKIFLFHAAIQYDEDKVLRDLNCTSPLVIGGSTSMVRGIHLLNTLGFYKFKLFGFDSSYEGKPIKVHGYNKKKLPIEVSLGISEDNENLVVKDKKFWTDPEMIIQCNDLEYILKNFLNLKIENYSEGLFREIYNYLINKRLQFKDLIK